MISPERGTPSGVNPGAALKRWVVHAPVGTARYWFCLTILVARLGADRRERLKLRLIALLAPLRDRLFVPKPRPFRLKVHGRVLCWWLGPKTDYFIINEVLLSDEYGFAIPEPPRVVLDLGSHIGVSLLYWRLRYPATRLIGIEPDPTTFTRLQRNASQLPAEVHRFAITDRNAPVDFFPDRQACFSSLVYDKARRRQVVAGRRLDTLISELGVERVDLLKIDIEHGELEALQASRRLEEVQTVVGEFADEGDLAKRNAFFSIFDGWTLEIRGALGEHTTFMAVRPLTGPGRCTGGESSQGSAAASSL
jgi:FkbM family methyltransferase